MKPEKLIEKTAEYVREIYAKHKSPELVYHDLKHTERVVNSCRQIADHYQLEEQDYTAVVVASWFHDIGYMFGPATEHEKTGAKMAEEFLLKHSHDTALMEKVKECIMATKMGVEPESMIAKIVCDADLFHLGTNDFYEINKSVRKEHVALTGDKISGAQWRKFTLPFIERHEFKTDYVKALAQKTLQQNIALLKDKIAEDSNKKEKEVKAKEEKTKEKENKPSRGIETMFRTTSTNHLRLSEMADSKANIMISVNSIIASILVSMLFRKLDDASYLLIPAILFLCTSLVSIIFAILVTRPNITQGTFTKEDIKKKRANLLFFGNFHKMPLKEYQEGITAMMNDSEFLYGSMTRDIYNLGVVLGRKYKMLRVAYSVFMFGFIISVIAFVVAVTVVNH